MKTTLIAAALLLAAAPATFVAAQEQTVRTDPPPLYTGTQPRGVRGAQPVDAYGVPTGRGGSFIRRREPRAAPEALLPPNGYSEPRYPDAGGQPDVPAPLLAAPQQWWDAKSRRPETAQDPLGGRRQPRNAAASFPTSPVDPLLYRLWGLQPLQLQALRPGELVLEVWARPAETVVQEVVRITVRQDGQAFVQARAGLGCCAPGVGRRIDIDEQLPAEAADRFRSLAQAPIWRSATAVTAQEAGAVQALCANGVSYDLILAEPGRARHLRRDCDPAEVGEAAEVLEQVIGAALGRDPRFDVLFRRGADFSEARGQYRFLLDGGGTLAAQPDPRPYEQSPSGLLHPDPAVDGLPLR